MAKSKVKHNNLFTSFLCTLFPLRTTLFLSFLLVLLLGGCQILKNNSNKNVTSVSGTNLLLNTVVTITLYGTADQSILDHCFTICKDYENIFSRTLDYSELHKINQSSEDKISLSKDMEVLLEKGLFYSQLSNGAFDITMGGVTSLWDFNAEEPTLPEKEKLEAALTKIDYRKISIQNHMLLKKDIAAQIDVGGIAKGYIADKIKDYLISQNVTSALIDLGGNILCVGEKYGEEPFQIGIQKPFEDRNETIAIMHISDQSVVSSGIYERCFEKNNILYHHILDPKTGYPYENDLIAVTIVSEQSVDGDALSTACFSLGLEDGLSLIDSIENTYAIFITKDYKIHYSQGFQENIELK